MYVDAVLVNLDDGASQEGYFILLVSEHPKGNLLNWQSNG